MVDGEPKYKYRFNYILDVNEKFEDKNMCVVEVSHDEPNIEWVLQDPDTREIDYGHPPKVIDQGTDGPIEDRSERPPYTLTRHDKEGPKGYTVYNLEEEQFEVNPETKTVKTEDCKPSIRKLNSSGVYNFKEIQRTNYIYTVKGDSLPLMNYHTYLHKEEGFYVTWGIEIVDCLQGKQKLWYPVAHPSETLAEALDNGAREKIAKNNIKTLHMLAYPEIKQKLPEDKYVEDDSIPMAKEAGENIRWYTRQMNF
jgi:hypothetical protein